jgi:hypothetical protein
MLSEMPISLEETIQLVAYPKAQMELDQLLEQRSTMWQEMLLSLANTSI